MNEGECWGNFSMHLRKEEKVAMPLKFQTIRGTSATYRPSLLVLSSQPLNKNKIPCIMALTGFTTPMVCDICTCTFAILFLVSQPFLASLVFMRGT